jgi:hypothetical protein
VSQSMMACDVARIRWHATCCPRWQVTCRAARVSKRTAMWRASIRPCVTFPSFHVSLSCLSMWHFFRSSHMSFPGSPACLFPVGPGVIFLLVHMSFPIHARVICLLVHVSLPYCCTCHFPAAPRLFFLLVHVSFFYCCQFPSVPRVRPGATGLCTWYTYSRIREGTWVTPCISCNYSYSSRTSRNRRKLSE